MSDLQTAIGQVQQAAVEIYANSAAVRSVGVGKFDDGYGYEVVKNSQIIELQSAEPTQIFGIPVRIRKTGSDVRPSVLRVPYAMFTQGAPTTFIPETQRTRPLLSGLQIQNYDADVRDGSIAKGFIVIGTLGCFIRTPNGEVALLSNNHVVAQQNHGVISDRIVQASAFTQADVGGTLVANLANFGVIAPSPVGASLATGNVVFNQVDAGYAVLTEGTQFLQSYFPSRQLPSISGFANPVPEQEVFKVGRTTGLTRGTIKTVATIVGPVGYTDGPSWFQNSFVIEGTNGVQFSDHGDSGSAIVSTDGKILGLLYAGNGVQTYACPITDVFNILPSTLA